jgi:CubicO group peptidase (beta-lactamase class C family)
MVPGGWSFTCALLLQAAAAPARFDAATFDPLVQQGIERGAYPGAALIVGRGDTVLFAKGYGRLTWRASGPAVDPDSTVYDLASLTKVVATTTALMLLVERGQVALDDPVERYLAEFPGELFQVGDLGGGHFSRGHFS